MVNYNFRSQLHSSSSSPGYVCSTTVLHYYDAHILPLQNNCSFLQLGNYTLNYDSDCFVVDGAAVFCQNKISDEIKLRSSCVQKIPVKIQVTGLHIKSKPKTQQWFRSALSWDVNYG